VGLSICRSIIGVHGGRLWVDEECASRRRIFSSPYPSRRGIREFSSSPSVEWRAAADAPQQMLLIDRLAKVANDAILQGAGP